ncbi:9282_t:CDS:1 [Ambispora gerdemannii]|uniref:9282_t:CDS:1 n=1 Tax=Ambispora gerdemannii TaxID=144530 RepID=A0A9N9FYS1_9GLOM|nr:9282_t:CDS:1 [Ambispora gerdemannii]
MASTLASLCLQAIFENFSTSNEEAEGEYSSFKDYEKKASSQIHNNKIYNNRRQLLYFALVNRHWCDNAIPYLWKRPFPLLSGISFISTLLRCFENDNHPRPLFQYNLFIKKLSLESFMEAIVRWSKSSQQRKSGKVPIPNILKSLFHHLINSKTNFYLELEYEDNIVSSLYEYKNWSIFQIPNAKESLRQLRYLKISSAQDIRLLESASKICLDLSVLTIISDNLLNREHSHQCELFSYFNSFQNLKFLRLDCGQYASRFYCDNFIIELARKLPKTLDTLIIEGDLKISTHALRQFLHRSRGSRFKLLGFPHSKSISDAHLDVILEVVKYSYTDIGIQRLNVSNAILSQNQVWKFASQGIELIS